jgi:hypothetical protein
MARHIHFHFYTGDAGEWKEGDHPRSENGQFGSGGARVAPTAKVSLKGNELGAYSDIKELRQKALSYAERFIGKKFTNTVTGNKIEVTRSGVKHTIHGSGEGLIKTVPAIPDLLQHAKLIASAPDKRGDPNIHSVETYEAPLQMEGGSHRVILTVKAYQDGRRYYDHGLVK